VSEPGGLFIGDCARLAILLTTGYAMYGVIGHGGWLGLLLCSSLAFISSDAVFYFRSSFSEQDNKVPRNNVDTEAPPPEQAKGYSTPHSDVFQATADVGRSSMGASTSGRGEFDLLTADEEIVRVLDCKDHYTVLGFVRFGSFDLADLKREYRKKVQHLSQCQALHLQFEREKMLVVRPLKLKSLGKLNDILSVQVFVFCTSLYCWPLSHDGSFMWS
jgi:DnaJ family protein C protein 14